MVEEVGNEALGAVLAAAFGAVRASPQPRSLTTIGSSPRSRKAKDQSEFTLIRTTTKRLGKLSAPDEESLRAQIKTIVG